MGPKITAQIIALLVAVSAGQAHADKINCRGVAEARTGSARVEIRLDGNTETARLASWTPVDDAVSSVSPLMLGYDMEGQKIGRLRMVSVVAVVLTTPLPRSRHATVEVRSDEGFWTRPWQLFAAQREELDKGFQGALAFTGIIPIGYAASEETAPLNTDLLNRIDPRKPVKVAIRGDAGEIFTSATYSRLDYAARDRLVSQALADALAKAKTRTSCKPSSG